MNPNQHVSTINSDVQTLVKGDTAFAFDLYMYLKDKEEGNLFFSPYRGISPEF